jgi:glycosyltransferase involved in cell wall biosynthesis
VHDRNIAGQELRLLFVGKDWARKGGPMAVEVTQALRAAGINARLHVVGCRPQLPPGAAEYIAVHGQLYQTHPEESAVLAELFMNAHFLLVPTTAECYGIVFAEAQAFALPPVSRAVQALSTVVEDGRTGVLLEAKAPASAYVERILALRADPAAYVRMAVAARERYESLLSWDSTAAGIVRALGQTLERQEAGSLATAAV